MGLPIFSTGTNQNRDHDGDCRHGDIAKGHHGYPHFTEPNASDCKNASEWPGEPPPGSKHNDHAHSCSQTHGRPNTLEPDAPPYPKEQALSRETKHQGGREHHSQQNGEFPGKHVMR